MRRVLTPQLPTAGLSVKLTQEEAHHLLTVLRMSHGATVEAIDGKGGSALAALAVSGKEVRLEYLGPGKGIGYQSLPLCLEVALLKAPAMEWVIEKAVEIGARRLVPVLAEHCVVKKDAGQSVERWQRIADQSLKQCGRPERLIVEPVTRLTELLKKPGPRIICDEGETGPGHGLLGLLEKHGRGLSSELSVLVGPEGGWTPTERKGFSGDRASLGELILRAETAAVFALSVAAAALRWPEVLAEPRQKN